MATVWRRARCRDRPSTPRPRVRSADQRDSRVRSSAPTRQRDQGEYTPTNQAPDPVLAQAFGRQNGNGESLQRHPADAGALDAERDGGQPDQAADPWRDPSATPSLGTPALPQPAPVVVHAPVGKLGVRDVLFGGKVSWLALATLLIIAIVIAFIGGWVGNKTAETVEAFTTSKVTLRDRQQSGGTRGQVRHGGRRRRRLGGDHRSHQRHRGLPGVRRRRRRPRLHRHQQPRHLRGRDQPQRVQDLGGVQRRQGGPRQPGGPRSQDRPGRAEGRQRRQPGRGPVR